MREMLPPSRHEPRSYRHSVAIGLFPALHAGCVQLPPPISHQPATYSDSVAHTARTMAHLVHAIDARWRSQGVLPSLLDDALPHTLLLTDDIWSNPIQFQREGLGFTLTSYGRDQVPGTEDDIVVTARLGRSLPCEVRTPFARDQYADYAPACATTPPQLLSFCHSAREVLPDLQEVREVPPHERTTRTGIHLVRLAWLIDQRGRAVGGVIPTLRAYNPVVLVDAWGNPLRYTPSSESFEIRSPGPDGVFDTYDDIFVQAEFTRPIPCEYRDGDQIVQCSIPPPHCPDH
jgi:hypothetical protein